MPETGRDGHTLAMVEMLTVVAMGRTQPVDLAMLLAALRNLNELDGFNLTP